MQHLPCAVISAKQDGGLGPRRQVLADERHGSGAATMHLILAQQIVLPVEVVSQRTGCADGNHANAWQLCALEAEAQHSNEAPKHGSFVKCVSNCNGSEFPENSDNVSECVGVGVWGAVSFIPRSLLSLDLSTSLALLSLSLSRPLSLSLPLSLLTSLLTSRPLSLLTSLLTSRPLSLSLSASLS